MDGTIAPVDKLITLADKYNAILFVDECHGTGVVGKRGIGTTEYYDVMGQVDIITSTFGKALGGSNGGFTTGRKEIIDFLRQTSRTYMFSNNMSPAVTAVALKAFEIMENDPALLEKLKWNSKYFRERMLDDGWELKGCDDIPIIPVMVYDAKTALEFSNELFEAGIMAKGLVYPIVGKGLARIRTQISSGHTKEQLDFAVDTFRRIGRDKG